MPNSRAANKRNVGGYLDVDIKDSIKRATPFDESAFVELSILKELLRQGLIKPGAVESFARERRIRATTWLQLQHEGVIQMENAKSKKNPTP